MFRQSDKALTMFRTSSRFCSIKTKQQNSAKQTMLRIYIRFADTKKKTFRPVRFEHLDDKIVRFI